VDDPPPGIIDTCPSCGGAIDVTDELPFAQIYCPHCGEGMRARRMFNNFELVELIGEGGMGSVFKAYDHTLARMVALKVLRREMSARDDERAKLEQEARVTASVNHPHVVRVYSFGEAGGQFYLAMELVEKGSLDDLMGIQTRVSEAQMLEIGTQVAQGLEAAAERGLIHRDVKPGNILFADAHTAKIVDFGLARVLADDAEARGEIWGTPYYIAPERLNYKGEDFRSDIYSLGGTLFHAIAGRPPFEAESSSLVALKQIKNKPVSLEAFAPDVAPETAAVIDRMLKKNPEDRYDSYEELVEHLEFARSKVLERAGLPRAAGREVVKLESNRTKRLITLIMVIAMLVLLGAGGWILLTSDRPEIKNLRETFKPSAANASGNSLAPGVDALAAGEWEKARELFAETVAASDGRGERGQWAQANLAAALALGGKVEQAREQWKKIELTGLFSDRPQDRALANMFIDAAGFALRGSAVKLGDLKKYPPSGPGALLYLFAGISDFSLGEKEAARGLLQQFLKAPPVTAVPYWDGYRRLAERLAAP